MAVYTKLTQAEIADFLTNYDIGDLLSFKGIIDGIDNSNYIIETSKDKYILTVFEQRMSQQNLPFFMDLKNFLFQNDVNCPQPILNKNGENIGLIKGKKCSIISFLNGQMLRPNNDGYCDNITQKHCCEIGRELANLHRIAPKFSQTRKNELNIEGMEKFFDNFSAQLEMLNIKEEITSYFKIIKNIKTEGITSAVVHGDIFPDNVFFDEKQNLAGIIDFYFASNDFLIYDIAVVINAWCFDGENIFDAEKQKILLTEYEKVRKIPEVEKELLSVMCLKAALRFFLTRLQDYFNTPSNSLVKVKNPKEYLEKLRFFMLSI